MRSGGLVLVHASLKSLGRVSGGAVAVLQALQDTHHAGTLVVPTHTSSPTRSHHAVSPGRA
ncbi:AAC(3) family N-acetyltransferase [Nocardia sp. NPDC001965]